MTLEMEWHGIKLYRKFSGNLSAQQIIDANLSLHGDERFDELRVVINDFTAVTSFSVSRDEINKIAGVDYAASLSNKRLAIVIVTDNDALLDWVAYYCKKMQGSPYQCKVFNKMDDAELWLMQGMHS